MSSLLFIFVCLLTISVLSNRRKEFNFNLLVLIWWAQGVRSRISPRYFAVGFDRI